MGAAVVGASVVGTKVVVVSSEVVVVSSEVVVDDVGKARFSYLHLVNPNNFPHSVSVIAVIPL